MRRTVAFGAVAIVLAGCSEGAGTTQTKASTKPARAARPVFIPTAHSDLVTEDDIAQLDALVRDTFGTGRVYARQGRYEWILTTKQCKGCAVYRLTHEGRRHPDLRLLPRSSPKEVESHSESLLEVVPLLIRREYVYISCHKGFVVFVGEASGTDVGASNVGRER